MKIKVFVDGEELELLVLNDVKVILEYSEKDVELHYTITHECVQSDVIVPSLCPFEVVNAEVLQVHEELLQCLFEEDDV